MFNTVTDIQKTKLTKFTYQAQNHFDFYKTGA